MKTTLELVHDLQALLSGPEKWTQGSYARNVSGEKVQIDDPQAVCFCLTGAFQYLSSGEAYRWLYNLASELADAPNGYLVVWNDTPGRTFTDIQSLMAKMEELAKLEAA